MLSLFAAGAILLMGCAQVSTTAPKQGYLETYRAPGLPASGQFRTLAIDDLDNDGKLDIAAGGSNPGTVGIWYGDGAGGMAQPIFLPLEADVRFLTVGDFDEDGNKDLAFSVQREASGVQVWKNLGDRQWQRGVGPTEIQSFQGIQTADIDRDGHLDLIAANTTLESNGGIQVWIGDGHGDWVRETGPTVTGLYMDVIAADFNEDGNLDLAGSGWGNGGALRVWLGDGHGGWTSMPPVERGNFYGIHVADINGDDHSDLLTGTYRAGIRVFLGDGDGRFHTDDKRYDFTSRWKRGKNESYAELRNRRGLVDLDSFWDVFPVDMDGDGDLDILTGSTANQGLRAWENTGDGNWKPIKDRFPLEGTYFEIVKADIDGDGREEIFSASFGSGIKVWKSGRDLDARKSGALSADSGMVKKEERIVNVLENDSFTTIDGIAEYRIGPRDVLEITIWKGIEATKIPVTVTQTGRISFGFVDNLYIQGLAPSQLDARLTEMLSKFFKDPKVDVAVKEYKSKFVSLMGAIGSGSGGTVQVELKGRTRVLDALGEEGGMAQNANLSEVRIRKTDGQAFTVDLAKAIFQGDPNQNVVLDPGDLVYVPWLTEEANRVYVLGEVKSPGIYTFKGSNMKIFDAVMKAGGVTIFAKEDYTKIVRGDATNPEVLSANIQSLTEDGDQTQNVSLVNGDLVYVPRSIIGDINLFVRRISPILQFWKTPGEFAREAQDFETTNRALRTD